MTDRGQVFDLGYQPYEGERLGRPAVRRAMWRDGLRRVAGLRRKARRKILPWSLAGLALTPAAVFLAINVLTSGIAGDQEFFGPAEYFSFNGTIILLFVALAAAELMVPDRVDGTLQVYASRPLDRTDYLTARAGALAGLMAVFLFVPQLLLFLGDAAVSSEGFLSHIGSEIDVLGRAALATAVYIAAYAPPALLIAALTAKTSFAAGIFLGGMFVSSGASAALVDANIEIFGLAALNHHPRYVTDWIFGVDTHAWIPERAGYEAWTSLAVIAVVAVACTYVLVRRYRRLI